jgi:hypothetical protein
MRRWAIALPVLLFTVWLLLATAHLADSKMSPPRLLTDPFLQLPTATSVQVVWFTEFAGTRHWVEYGNGLEQRTIAATTQLSRTYEDADSHAPTRYEKLTFRPIWRHEAQVTGLTPALRLPYRVTSTHENGAEVTSATFSLTASPNAGKRLQILLTSDHQLKAMTAANLQKVVETVGAVDAVFFAGDLANVPDRASGWFDDAAGNAFFPVLQGRADHEREINGVKTRYHGGALIQNAPLFPAIGNHEVMGRFSTETSLNRQFYDAVPRAAAEERYNQTIGIHSTSNSLEEELRQRAHWIKNQSFNTDTYEEIFSLPQDSPGGKTYYALTFGDVRLVVLYATNIWRVSGLDADARGKYRERSQDLEQPEAWGHGQHIFEPIAAGSPQYNWLAQELKSPAFRQAKYKVVMLHHPFHSLGENAVPAYTNPVAIVERDVTGKPTARRYEYPKQADYLIRDVLPLLEAAKVQLVFFGHSHLWNRFVSPTGMHFLETSNVGNSYGAYVGAVQRSIPIGYQEDYALVGNPNGLEPVLPTIAPLSDPQNRPLPYIASNDITVFSIFDTGTGTISSYRFDTRQPDSAVVKFDQFELSGTDARSAD